MIWISLTYFFGVKQVVGTLSVGGWGIKPVTVFVTISGNGEKTL